ncbi:aldo/keto reductase [Pantoea eucrina]|uniref:Aldo/keto reductase n=1 Tax=Pantoea eucrina TaxID=472693 RepID=A0ABU5LBT3_9GAMM|nr:aldo/keto reductase [Pantoea eucrina]MDZ7277395.1 aldo/keto reductase [Pantoea eucrina]
MQSRYLTSSLRVSALGLGCMGMSEFYGPRDDDAAMAVLDKALTLGIYFFDTADMYGCGHNEALLGKFIRSRKPALTLATKFGIVRQPGEYRRGLCNTPDYARQSCEASHLNENVRAQDVQLSDAEQQAIRAALSSMTIRGERYTPEGMKGING